MEKLKRKANREDKPIFRNEEKLKVKKHLCVLLFFVENADSPSKMMTFCRKVKTASNGTRGYDTHRIHWILWNRYTTCSSDPTFHTHRGLG